MALSSGTRLGPYEILAPIGVGGMGEVYKARDSRLNRFVAIKTSKAQFNERFMREAQAIAALNHPHICQLYDIGPDYLVLEYVDGGPLRGPLPVNAVVRLAIQIVEALQEAHGKGILHRDLKPGNIMVTAKGAAKLLDFGLAKMTIGVDSDATWTLGGTVMGTAAYMSPEQAQGKPLDERSDIFSLGAVLYEMLSGTRAFKGDSTADVLSAVLRDDPSPLSAPVALRQIVMQCLAKRPEKRFQMMAEAKAALDLVQAQMVRSEQANTAELAVLAPLPMVREHTALRFGESKLQPTRLREEEVRSDQAVPLTPDRRDRHALLQRVRQDWISGVLKQSLYGVARIELGLESRADSVEQPLRALVQILDHSPTSSPGTNIAGVFDESGGALLILGQPGTGKTTLLLELAEELLNRAGRDEGHPIPVVFNLTSWALRRQPLKEWLVAELNEGSDVPTRLAKRWVESDQILPLLDGLDEVASSLREGCVEAINDFRREHGLVPIAVCSRIADYEALGRRLRLRRAVVVQPLTRHQIQEYLEQAGDQMRALRIAANEDPVLAQLIETPLMLWVAVLTYRDHPAPALIGDFEQQRTHLFAVFVSAMFQRRAAQFSFGSGRATLRYNREDATRWLSWLASSMLRLNQTIFHMESLDKTWIPGKEATIRWHFVATLAFLMARSLSVLFFLGNELLGVDPVRSLAGAFVGAVLGAGWGGFIGVCLAHGGALDAYVPVDTVRWSWNAVVKALVLAMEGVLTTWPTVALIYALNEGFSPAPIPTRRVPNAGVRSSLRNGLITGVLQGLLVGASLAALNALVRVITRSEAPAFPGLVGSVPFGMALASLFGLEKGAGFYLKNRVIRRLLRRKGYAPQNYVDFLDFCCERLFLQRVGGGYMFVHRTLMEYFSSLSKPRS